MVTGFLILGLIKKFEGSSFTFAVGTVLPFFFTGSWNKIMGKVIMTAHLSLCNFHSRRGQSCFSKSFEPRPSEVSGLRALS